jgi:hypothetical protein
MFLNIFELREIEVEECLGFPPLTSSLRATLILTHGETRKGLAHLIVTHGEYGVKQIDGVDILVGLFSAWAGVSGKEWIAREEWATGGGVLGDGLAGTLDFFVLVHCACACHHRRENERCPHNIGAGRSHLTYLGLIMPSLFV